MKSKVTSQKMVQSRIKSILARFPQVKLAILYGSFATNKQTRQSDIDLGIAGRAPLSPEERVEISIAVSENTGREVDVVDLNQASGVLLKEILTKGKLLLNLDSDLHFRLVKKHLYFQADFMPLLNMILENRRVKFINES